MMEKLIQLDNMPIKPTGSENENEFISRCMSEENSSFPDEAQRYAVCKSKWDTDNLSKIKDTTSKVMAKIAYDTNFRGIKLVDDGLEGACWEGYSPVGLKPMGNRMVPNCVPDKD